MMTPRKTPKLPARHITAIRGFRAVGGTCGIKPSGKPDLMLIVADKPYPTAGVFTRNQAPGAPVTISKRHIRNGTAQAIVCNSGNANVCTGEPGLRDAVAMCDAAASALTCKRQDVLVCSTGIIGRPLPIDKITHGIADLSSKLTASKQADHDAARAILTTDLIEKTATVQTTIAGKKIRIAGMAKGSGMIAPNMATMLAFITTDAAITSTRLQHALRQAVANTFNRSSVDEDTSTSDSVLIMASGAANNRAINRPGKSEDQFIEALTALCADLTYQVIRDGEGATKTFRVQVRGAKSVRDADRVGKSVVGSPLVKTAIHGCDPNWGRIVAATGRSGARMVLKKLSVAIDKIQLVRDGEPIGHQPKKLAQLAKIMQDHHIDIIIDLGVGQAQADWLGCDLTREYIRINADYTT